MLILIGASASGKTEVAKTLAKKYNITKIVTYTTRAPRVNERNGVDYNFVSVEEFAKLTSEDYFVETTYYNNNYYGTAKKDVKDDKCIILDPNGVKSFNALNDNHVISIYLDSDESFRHKRMLERGDLPQDVEKRLINDRITFNKANLTGIDFIIESNDISIEELSVEVKDVYLNALKDR